MKQRLMSFLILALLALGSAQTAVAEDGPSAPEFQLSDCSGKTHKLADYRGKWVVLEWVNYDCPFVVKQYHPSHKKMQTLQKTYTGKGIVWLSICSSAEGKQGYMTAAGAAKRLQAEGAAPTALLLDPTGKVGRQYRAKTTPDMRILDPEGRIVYSGAIDSVVSKDPADVAKATNYVAKVLDDALGGRRVEPSKNRPYGCSVKYAAAPGGVGSAAPAFRLTDSNGKARSLSEFQGKWVVLEWVNYDCPFVVKQYHASHKNMQRLQKTYTDKGVVWLSICSSAEGKQGYLSQEAAASRLVKEGAAPTALLLDPTGSVGRQYGARTTPDMRIIDPKGKIVYSGAIDSVRSKNPADVAGATNHVEQALDAVLAGKDVPVHTTRAYGCSVKYARAGAGK